MLIIAGYLIVDAADRDTYVTDSVTTVEQARRADGCLDFSITADSIDPGRIDIYERWNSDEELLDFRGTGPDGDTNARILNADVHKYRISAVEVP